MAVLYQAWDVVMVETEQGTILGRVSEVEGGVAVVDVLESLEDGGGDRVWVATGARQRVEQQAVLAVLDYDYSQRIDPDRQANPHGEHAEELFTLAEALPEAAAGRLKKPYI